MPVAKITANITKIKIDIQAHPFFIKLITSKSFGENRARP